MAFSSVEILPLGVELEGVRGSACGDLQPFHTHPSTLIKLALERHEILSLLATVPVA